MKLIGFVLVACLFSLSSFSQECPDSCVVYISNMLTPDCDGIDCEILQITTNRKFREMNFILYNKWGEIIFETDDPRKKFDSHGYPPGTYSWKLKGVFCNDKALDYTGQVTIIH